jgi:hypothetical protein
MFIEYFFIFLLFVIHNSGDIINEIVNIHLQYYLNIRYRLRVFFMFLKFVIHNSGNIINEIDNIHLQYYLNIRYCLRNYSNILKSKPLCLNMLVVTSDEKALKLKSV